MLMVILLGLGSAGNAATILPLHTDTKQNTQKPAFGKLRKEPEVQDQPELHEILSLR